MKMNFSPVNILMADDDADDRELMKEALQENNLAGMLRFVEDGAELLDYLYRKGKFSSGDAPRPELILLDLNMPKVDGREALKRIKSDPGLRRIPVVILTTSRAEQDILSTYDLGVNSFISKPTQYADLIQVAKQISHYWFKTVELPKE
jgi:two-component system response regulator